MVVENITGIRTDPGRPGFKHIILEPRLGGDLTWARGEYRSPYGMVKSHWSIREGTFTWDVSIPPNTTATAFVPADDGALITENDRPAELSPGVELIERSEKTAVINLQSGNYQFIVSPFSLPGLQLPE
jgi:alpha-L-rhamnosidase